LSLLLFLLTNLLHLILSKCIIRLLVENNVSREEIRILNKKLVLGMASITVFATVALLGCSANDTTATTKNVLTQEQKKSETSNTKDTAINKTEVAKVVAQKVTAAEPLSQLKYVITSIPSDTKIELNTPWETSPLGKFKATVEGKGEKAKEEGYSYIVIKDEKSGKLSKLTLENQEKNKITAKDLEWIDESNMFVILGQPFGTVTKGGKIYKVNITNGETSLYVNTTPKEEYTAVGKSGSEFNFEKYVYEDDNFTIGHSESGILELK
jgi:hypothetical protein